MHCTLAEKDRLAAISPKSDRGFLFDGARNFHSALMLAARTTLAHASVFSTTNFARSAGELTNGSPPKSTIRLLIVGFARPTLISWLSLSIISGGVPLGAPMPIHPLA